jgi:hypothetical protein
LLRVARGLERGVVCEGPAGFIDGDDVGEVGERADFEPERRDEFGELAPLFTIAGADDERVSHARQDSDATVD